MKYNVYDKYNVAFKQFDLIKVYHFTGVRRKKYYMYKHVLGFCPRSNESRIILSHLDGKPESYYTLALKGQILTDYEIIQSALADEDERRKVAKNEN